MELVAQTFVNHNRDPYPVKELIRKYGMGPFTHKQLYEIAVEVHHLAIRDPIYLKVAGRIVVDSIRSQVNPSFSETVLSNPLNYSKRLRDFCSTFGPQVDALIIPELDNDLSILQIGVFSKGYLQQLYHSPELAPYIETPQYAFMRVALFWYGCLDDSEALVKVARAYTHLSKGTIHPSTPILQNAGTASEQCSACFVGSVPDDTEGILQAVRVAGHISKNTGGLGFDFSRIRSGRIGRSHYLSAGPIPFAKIFESAMMALNQGGKRMANCMLQMKVWNVAVMDFITAREPGELKVPRIWNGISLNYLFGERVRKGEKWSLFDPNETPSLIDLHGDLFEAEYLRLEAAGKAVKVVDAGQLLETMVYQIIKFGTPFVRNHDAVNEKSNQSHLGDIPSSNLCQEMEMYHNPEEMAVCVLASLVLKTFARPPTEGAKVGSFAWTEFEEAIREAVRALNQTIDLQNFPKGMKGVEKGLLRHRYIGLGVQGLADVATIANYAWVSKSDPGKPSKKWRVFNSQIFETIYYVATDESAELAATQGSYETFQGSYASKGILQPDLWARDDLARGRVRETLPSRYSPEQWGALRNKVRKGMRNSQVVALMPTATAANIRGSTENFEPLTGLIHAKNILSGHYLMVNESLVSDLRAINAFTPEVVSSIISDRRLPDHLPERLRRKYLTAYQMRQQVVLTLANDRDRFVCQSSSHNFFWETPEAKKVAHFILAALEMGQKNISYYHNFHEAEKATDHFTPSAVVTMTEADRCSGVGGACGV